MWKVLWILVSVHNRGMWSFNYSQRRKEMSWKSAWMKIWLCCTNHTILKRLYTCIIEDLAYVSQWTVMSVTDVSYWCQSVMSVSNVSQWYQSVMSVNNVSQYTIHAMNNQWMPYLSDFVLGDWYASISQTIPIALQVSMSKVITSPKWKLTTAHTIKY